MSNPGGGPGRGREPVPAPPVDPTRRKRAPPDARGEDLLVAVAREVRIVSSPPPAAVARERTRAQLERLHHGIRRFVNPHQYPVGLSLELHELKTRLVLQ